MKLRLSFNVSGENFNTQLCIERLYSNELKAEYDVDCPNHLSWVHPDEFTDYRDYESRSAYEKAYLNFIITNINILDRCRADDFSIFTEIYIQADEQCNFETLSEGFYPYIWKYTIRMPTSVYICDEEGGCAQDFLLTNPKSDIL